MVEQVVRHAIGALRAVDTWVVRMKRLQFETETEERARRDHQEQQPSPPSAH